MIKSKNIRKKIGLINNRLRLVKNTRLKSVKSILSGSGMLSGKRVRGLLVLLTAETKMRINTRILNTAAAIELLHHATLIHDDIIDDSASRRGGRTLNRSLGRELSVLAGDYLFSRVVSLMTGGGRRALFSLFAETVKDICEGEIEEVYNRFNPGISEKHYYAIIRKKTASLIEASVKAGAIEAGIYGAKRRHLADFGRNIGMAFQIKDDILDVVSSEGRLGKPAGRDIDEGKITLPLILALNAAESKEKAAVKKLFAGGKKRSSSKKITEFIRQKQGGTLALREAERFVKKAEESLDRALKNSGPAKKGLIETAYYIIKRKN